MVNNHTDSRFILDPARDDYVGDEPLRLDVAVEDRFDEAEPLLDGAFDGPPTFSDVADDFMLTMLRQSVLSEVVCNLQQQIGGDKARN